MMIIIIIMVTGRGDETTPGKPRPLGAAWLGQERQQGGGAHHHHHLLSQQYHYKDIHFVNSTLLTLVETYLEPKVNRVYRKMAVLLHPDKTEVNFFIQQFTDL